MQTISIKDQQLVEKLLHLLCRETCMLTQTHFPGRMKNPTGPQGAYTHVASCLLRGVARNSGPPERKIAVGPPFHFLVMYALHFKAFFGAPHAGAPVISPTKPNPPPPPPSYDAPAYPAHSAPTQ